MAYEAGSPWGVLKAVAEPNPNPACLRVLMEGPADAVEWRVYTPALACAAQGRGGPVAAGWNRVPLGAELDGLASGLYHVQVRAVRGPHRSWKGAQAKLHLAR